MRAAGSISGSSAVRASAESRLITERPSRSRLTKSSSSSRRRRWVTVSVESSADPSVVFTAAAIPETAGVDVEVPEMVA